jgi:hypothetical protein
MSGLLQQREPAGRRAPICGRGQFAKPASAHLCAEGGFEDAILLVGRDNVGLLYPTPRQRRECRMVRAGSQHPHTPRVIWYWLARVPAVPGATGSAV